MKNYLILAASSGKNLELANKIKEHATDDKTSFEVVNLEELALPLYSPNAEKSGIPENASKLATKLIKASGLIFLSPEYNGSTAPLFNNTIAWISRTGDDWREAFNDKVTVVGTHSGGGGHQVLSHMQDQLSYVGCNVIGRKILTSYAKELNLESLDDVLNRLYKLS